MKVEVEGRGLDATEFSRRLFSTDMIEEAFHKRGPRIKIRANGTEQPIIPFVEQREIMVVAILLPPSWNEPAFYPNGRPLTVINCVSPLGVPKIHHHFHSPRLAITTIPNSTSRYSRTRERM
jgi:hypothetical protein